MASYPLVALAPFLGLCADVFVHVAASWLTAGKRILHCLLAGMAAGLFTTAGVSLLALGGRFDIDGIFLLVFNLVASLALAYCYFCFVNLNLTSLRIRMLQELRASPDGLSRAGILKLYNARTLVDRRIDRLTQGGQMRQVGGRFYTRPSVLLTVARIINLLKLVVLNQRPGRASKAAMKQGVEQDAGVC
jgi:hypothetical protein